MAQKGLTYVAILIIATCLAASVDAATYSVSTSGSDSNSGSASAPWRTLHQAMATMVAGDTTIVEDGTYVEDYLQAANNGTQNAPITLKARNQWGAVLSSISTQHCNAAIFVTTSWLVIDGLKITPDPSAPACTGTRPSSANAAVRCWGSNTPHPSAPTTGWVGCTVRNALVDDPRRMWDSGIKTDQDLSLMEGNTIHHGLEAINNYGSVFRNNTLDTGDAWGDIITSKTGSRNFQAYNNRITINSSVTRGLVLGGGSSGNYWWDNSTHIECYNCAAWNNVVINSGGAAETIAIGLSGAYYGSVFNNVIIGSLLAMQPGSESGLLPYPENFNPIFENNIIVCNGNKATDDYAGWSAYLAGTLLVDYNDFQNCASGVPTQAHPVLGDPLFVNASSDWHLQSGSPASGAGIAVAALTGFNDPTYGQNSIDISKDFSGVIRTAPWSLGVYATNGAPPPPPPPPSQNPLAYFKFDETSGTSAADSSGSGNTLTLTAGAAFAPGKIGNALSLDGISGQAGANSSSGLNFSQALTIAAWINPLSSTATYRTIFVKADGTNYTRGYAFNIWNNYLNLAKVGALNVPSTIALTTGAWQHVAVTFDASTGLVKFYLNGALSQTITNATAIVPPLDSDPMAVGAWVGGASYFPGLIDELKAYNRALSDSEIAALTATPTPAPVITSAGTATGTAGTAFSYQIAASNSPTSFNATGLPAGLSINTGTGLISGTPTTAGTSNVAISASNAGGTGSATLALTINNPPPKLAVALNVACAPNCPLNGTTTAVTVAVTSGTAVSMDFSRDGQPVFLTCPGNSQCYAAPGWGFDWCITSNCWGGIGGQHILNVTAHDASGQTATASVTINVSDTPPPLVTDLNGDGVTNVLDVQLAVNQALGVTACTNGDVNKDGVCNMQDVQLVVNKALGL